MSKSEGGGSTIAVLIPCYNEEISIGEVVTNFRTALPAATVYVYDNASDDRTAEVARGAGAIVRTELLRGKGNVVRRMFADVDADIYLMADGDATYDAGSAVGLIHKLESEGLDMVVGRRVGAAPASYRFAHRWGNAAFTSLVAYLFGKRFEDILSGYRAFSRRFVKSFPALSTGFEIETELTIHALELRMPVAEIATPYAARPANSSSKLRTDIDGFRILVLIVVLFKNERPLQFFGAIATVLFLASIVLAIPLVLTYIETGLVPRVPTAILSTGLMIVSFLGLACGLVLDTVTRGRKEMKRLAYLALSQWETSRRAITLG